MSSGVFEGKTTGTPIALLIKNEDQKTKDYQDIKDIYRPSHADYVYDKKYGKRDYRGGGRSSARETACRVVAGAIAKQILSNITVSNGIAFSQEENIMYFADTPTARIQKFEYSQDFKKFHELDSNLIFNDVGVPDGATMDSQNNYWSARVRSRNSIGSSKRYW